MKIKSSMYQCLLSIFLLICVITACTPLSPQSHPKPDAPSTVVQVIPTATQKLPPETPPKRSETQVPTPTFTPQATETLPPTIIPEATGNPNVEVVSEELAEQIKSIMPPMWFYDRDQKKFVIRPNDDFVFSIYRRTTLRITDSNGEEVGYARYFNKNHLDSENTEYFSLTDQSRNTLIPLKLYSQMGEFNSRHSYTLSGIKMKPVECMFAFSENYQTYVDNTARSPESISAYQNAVAVQETYAPGATEIEFGDKLVETALVRVVAEITEINENEVYNNIKNDIPMILTVDGKDWIFNNGVDFVWGNTDDMSFDIVDNHLITYEGGAISSKRCDPMRWGVSFQRNIARYFSAQHPDLVKIYRHGISPFLSVTEFRIPVIAEVIQYTHEN